MPDKFKNIQFKKFGLILYSVFLLAFAPLFLIATPKAVGLVESKVAFFGNEPQVKTKPLIQEKIEEKIPTVQIIDKKIPPPKFNSQAVLAEDLDSGKILFEKNIHNRLPPASTTKIMTAVVAIEHFKAGEILTVPQAALVGGSSMGLGLGEELTFRSLLYGMLLNSGNDAAYTIALNYPGGMDTFVEKMNEKVEQLNLADSHFQNPAGFDGNFHFSSAFDLAEIAKTAIADPYLSKIVATKETSILAFDKTKLHNLHNLNKLLSEDGVLGVKTGTTEKAGENFVGLVERGGHKVLTVVLSSEDRFGETKKLMDWVYQNYEWKLSE